MRQTAASFVGTRNINRLVTLLDIRDLAILIDYKRRSVGHPHLGDQHAILLGNRTHMVAEHGIRGAEFFFPVSQRRAEIRTDRQHLRIVCIELGDTRLVSGEFLRSTTGEGGDEER